MDSLPTVNHEISQIKPSDDYPEEVWREILLKLWLHEDYFEHVLICRKVCRLWEKLVDEMPPKLFWNPWLMHRFNEFGTIGYPFTTVIDSSTDIRKVLSQDFNTDKNPFRNHTLSLVFVKTKNDEENILKILKDHGRHVIKFLYHPIDESPKALTTLPTLLSHMKNIKTLCLHFPFLSKKQVMAIDANDFQINLKHLRELVLPRTRIFVKDDNIIYSKLSIPYASQIQSLTLDFLCLDFNQTNIVERFANLQDLKIWYFTVHSDVLVEPLPEKEWPNLKRLALCSPSRHGPIVAEITLRFIGLFAKTLQLLSMDMDLCILKTVCESSEMNNFDVTATFPKLTQLILQLWMMYHKDVLVKISLERRLHFLLPNLKSIVFEDTELDIKNRDINEAKLQEICAPLWPLVPSSVENISFRFPKTSSILLQPFTRNYKCKRNEVYY